MAPILKIQCPKCGGKLKITPQDTPSKFRCPGCQATIKVPPLSELQGESADEDEWADDQYASEEVHSDSESESEWDEYGEDDHSEDDDEPAPRPRRRPASRTRKGTAKKNASRKSRDDERSSNGKIAVIAGGAVFGIAITGLLIYVVTSGPADEEGGGEPVAANGGGNSESDTGGTGTKAVSPVGGDEVATSPAEIAVKARQFVREQAGLVDAPPRGTWGNTASEIRRNWDLAADPLPERDYAALQELSTKNAGISFGEVGPENTWCSLPRPERGQNSILVNLESWTGRQLQGERASMSTAAEIGYVSGGAMSDDGTLIGRELRVNRSRLDAREHWVTIHEYDNTLVKVIPGAKAVRFLAGHRILLATDDIAEPATMSKKDAYNEAKAKHLLSRAVWFEDVETDEKSARIEIRNGGQWLLSPTRKYLVIVEPDADTASQLNDLAVPHFDGMPSSTEVTVYDTSTGDKVADAAYSNLTVGFVGAVTDDGTRLAVHAGQHVAVLDMTTGTVLKTGTRIDVGDHTKPAYRPPVWMAGNHFLLLDWNRIVDIETGIAFGGFSLPGRTSREPVGLNDWLAGEYVRYSQSGGYWHFPVDQLISASDAITDPARNLLAQRQVTLKLSGVDKLSPLEQDMVRECLKAQLETRCDLKVADEETDAFPIVEVAYSESRKEGPFSMERWHQDATRQVVNTDRTTWVKDQYVLDVSLEFRCLTADGRVLAEHEGRNLGVPAGMNFEIPGSIQFRNSAIIKASENLTLDVPALVPPDAEGASIPRYWPVEIVKADPPDYAAMSIEKINVDNSWLGEQHGLPVRFAAMHFSDEQRKEHTSRGIGKYFFVRQKNSPAMLMQVSSGEWLLTPIGPEVSITKPQLPAARRFALHPNGSDFAAFQDRQLTLGNVNQPAQTHPVEIDPNVVIDMSFSGDGKLLAIGRGQKTGISVYAVDDLKKISRLDDATAVATFNEPNVQSFMSFSRNKNLFVTASRDAIIVWDVDSKRGIFEHRIKRVGLKAATVRAVAIGPDGKRLFASLGDDVVEFSLETLMEVRRFPEPDATALAMSPTGDRLAIARQTDTIAVMKIDGEPSLQIYNMGNSTNGRPKVGWSYDGSMMFGFGTGGLSVWKMDAT